VYESLVKHGHAVCRCGLEEERNRRSIEIPTWMFEPAACCRLRVMAAPTVSVDALLELQALLRTAPRPAPGVVLQAQHRSLLPAGGAELARIATRLAECARDVDREEVIPADQLSALLCQIGALQTVLAARLVRDLQIASDAALGDGDRLLTVAEAAERLACSKDWLYRHRLPFAVRNGRQLRFSADGLDRYIRQRAGRETTSLSHRTEP
jgi:excisionase family DNA binding protein